LFSPTGPMTTARTQPTATLLNSGKVLIVGGNAVAGDLSAELYDPVTGKFTATGPMTTARTGPTATLLSSGKVLVAGGTAGTTSLLSAELYDPVTGTFSATAGNMTVARAGHTAIRLQDGTVLIVDTVHFVGTETTADLYDPVSETFTAVGNPLAPAFSHTLNLRSDGSVLVIGALRIEQLTTYHTSFFIRCVAYPGTSPFPVGTAVVGWFAPESEGFTLAGDGISSRDGGHTATTLEDGTILVVGGTWHSVGRSTPCRSPIVLTTTLSSAELIK